MFQLGQTYRLQPKPLCNMGKPITAIRATNEGPRPTLVIASQKDSIQVRDARNGLLLRLIEIPELSTVRCIQLDGGILLCGTEQKQLLLYEFSVSCLLN